MKGFERPVFMRWYDRHDHTLVWPDDLPVPDGIEGGERRFKIKQAPNPFHQVIESITGLAIQDVEGGAYVYGDRSMYAPQEDGYVMRGRISVNGKTVRTFTSSHMFLIRGKLVKAAALHVSSKAGIPRGYKNPVQYKLVVHYKDGTSKTIEKNVSMSELVDEGKKLLHVAHKSIKNGAVGFEIETMGKKIVYRAGQIETMNANPRVRTEDKLLVGGGLAALALGTLWFASLKKAPASQPIRFVPLQPPSNLK